jgi:hypothetical protein
VPLCSGDRKDCLENSITVPDEVRTLVYSATAADNGSDSEDRAIEIKWVDLGDGPSTDTASPAVIFFAYIISIPRSVTPR